LNDTSIIGTLPPAVRRVVLEGFADSMHTVFLTTFFLMIPAFLLTFFIKEVPLRSMGGLAAQRAEAAERDAADVEMDNAKAETAVL
jgi:hypothetical protein